MLLRVICVGKLKDKAINNRCLEFMKWLRNDNKVELIELADSSVAKEGQAILKAVGNDYGYLLVLSEEGKSYTSREFANFLQKIDQRITCVIGGPFGLAKEVKEKANQIFSLSTLTFTHEIARLLLFEQLFRASNIQHNGQYHND